jgi:Mg-chelatase subunit ChlD
MLIFEPLWPWSYIAVVASVLAVALLLVRGFVDYLRGENLWRRLGGNKTIRIVVLILSVISASLLAAAAMNPRWTDKPGDTGFHLQVAVDVSDSVMRARGGWERVKKQAHEKIINSISKMKSSLRDKCTAGILTFRDNTNEAFKKRPLKDLAKAFIQLDKNMFASGEGTDIEKGLNRAASLMEKAGGQGAVLLISDGNQTSGNALNTAQQLSRQGIPIHVFPVTSQGPAVAITDADLPRQIHSNVKTFVRGLMLNQLTTGKQADLMLTKDSGNNSRENPTQEPLSAKKQVSLPSGKWVRFRWPVIFEKFGLQFIDLSLIPAGGKESHHRRFFTYVKRPPRILAIGGDNRWISAVPGDTAEIIPVDPSITPITPGSLEDIDAVVISSVPAYQLTPGTMNAVAEAVKNRGMGLMLINGGHQGADVESETVIMSYKETSIEPLLPVIGGPRPFTPEPPPRQIAILIDTSGSMGSGMIGGVFARKIHKAKEIARYIVSELLRPKDRLDLITFTTGAGHLVYDQVMNEEGKQYALDMIDRIKVGGGTDPNRALGLIGDRRMAECGLIFISDGEFGYVGYRPDCRTTVFEIGSNRVSRSKAMQQLADPIPVGARFDPKAITIPYFEPEKRDKFFEAGTFTPLSMEKYLPKNERLPVPALDLEGAAVSYLKDNAILNAVRPKLTDPVLAYGKGGEGFVGFFAAEVPETLLRSIEGQKALEAWIGRLIPFMERDRYNFKLEDRGDEIDLFISLAAKSGKIPNVKQMTAGIRFSDQETVGIPLRADDTAPAAFYGEIRVKRSQQTRHAVLSIRESGPDALPGAQRIPIFIPPKGSINPPTRSEAYTYGQNRILLKKIAEQGGGIFDPPPGTPFFKEKPKLGQGYPLWPYLAAAAVFCYLAAIALKRWSS